MYINLQNLLWFTVWLCSDLWILIRIWIREFLPLGYGSMSGSGFCSFLWCLSRCQQKVRAFQVFLLIAYRRFINISLHILQVIYKSVTKLQISRFFLQLFCLLMEGFGSVRYKIITDSDLGALKSEGSYRSGSGTLRFFLLWTLKFFLL
jgi:hypothetical protein